MQTGTAVAQELDAEDSLIANGPEIMTNMGAMSVKRDRRGRDGCGLLVALGLLVANACSSDSHCDAGRACGGLGGAGEGGLSTGATPAGSDDGGAMTTTQSGGAAAGQRGELGFAGEPPLGGEFVEPTTAGGGQPSESCLALYLPLLVSRNFRPLVAGVVTSPGCTGDRAPLAAGDCFALRWSASDFSTVSWMPGAAGPHCLEAGATRVHFQARADEDDQIVSFAVAPGVETGPLHVHLAWGSYDLDVSKLDYVRFDAPASSLPPGLVAFSVTPLQATAIYVDDLRWVRASEANQ